MIIVNYDLLFKKYDNQIISYAKKIDNENFEDYAQEIRIYIFKNIARFNPEKSSFSYYIKLLIITSFRRLIFDKKKQHIFEDSFLNIADWVSSEDSNSTNEEDEFLSLIVCNLKDPIKISIFYALLYNKDNKKYIEIAKTLNMDYNDLVNNIISIKRVIKKVFREN